MCPLTHLHDALALCTCSAGGAGANLCGGARGLGGEEGALPCPLLCPHNRARSREFPTDRAPKQANRRPTVLQAYNKRATLLYMMRRYEPSIADCKEVLRLQPLHFGAASGMGLCQ